jgi:crotonobetainyl-CoA:carnitine CoA-transferase CaiB-like acyl-CoA transferase
VFIEGFRPGVIGRLGYGYEAVSAANPRILYLSVSGFGQTGPFAERPAMDPVLQAFTGLTIENKGEDGIPHRVPVIPIDMMTAMYAFQAVSAALYARRDETRGKFIEVSLMQAAALLQSVRMMASYLEGGEILQGAAPSGIFQAADGWINITVVRTFEWEAFCAAIDRPDLPKDPRFKERDDRIANSELLFSIVRPIVQALTNEQLSARLTKARIMHERLNTYADFLAHEHTKATGIIAWLSQPGVPQKVPLTNIPGAPPLADGTPRAHAPVLGEHTEQVLREHGFSQQQILELSAKGAIGLMQAEAPATAAAQ